MKKPKTKKDSTLTKGKCIEIQTEDKMPKPGEIIQVGSYSFSYEYITLNRKIDRALIHLLVLELLVFISSLMLFALLLKIGN